MQAKDLENIVDDVNSYVPNKLPFARVDKELNPEELARRTTLN